MTDDRFNTLCAVVLTLSLVAFNAGLIAGTAYVVFWLGQSGWWWLLTVCLMVGSSSAKATVK